MAEENAVKPEEITKATNWADVDDEDDDDEEVAKIIIPPKVEEEKKIQKTTVKRDKTDRGDYIVTKFVIADRKTDKVKKVHTNFQL